MTRRISVVFAVVLLCLLIISTALTTAIYAQDTATVPPTNTERPTYTPAPTFTLAPSPTLFVIPARLCLDCTRVRLRAGPGTAGEVLAFVDNNAELLIKGRTADNAWLLVRVKGVEGDTDGWISEQYVRLPNMQPLDPETLGRLPVSGVAVEASPVPTASVDVPNWLSGITAHARQIYLHGKSLGNRANVFSRVGDSITVSPYFLTPIGLGQYDLGRYGYLSAVIGFFSQADARQGNSFVNPPLAAGGGWSAYNLLQPGPVGTCGADSLLVCEYKLVKPSVALIMVGTNDSGSGSPDQFGGTLRQIVQTSIDMGVIPVISTIPPKRIDADQTARVNAFNEAIRAIARQYDVPLWDFWAVMESLPNEGMSTDGLHPSVPPDGASCRFSPDNLQYGYTVRNLTALQVLDAVWRLVLY